MYYCSGTYSSRLVDARRRILGLKHDVENLSGEIDELEAKLAQTKAQAEEEL